MKISDMEKICEARASADFKVEFRRKAKMGDSNVVVIGYSHQPGRVSQYHDQPREFRVALFSNGSRVVDWVV